MSDLSEQVDFVTPLTQSLGRPLRVAHVGNIANNAYLAAKAERSVGIESIVLSPNYMHVMGFPSWEEVCSTVPVGNHFSGDPYPDSVPEWFLSGTWSDIFQGLKVHALSDSRRNFGAFKDRLELTAATASDAALNAVYARYRERLLSRLKRQTQDRLANSSLFSIRYRLALAWTRRLAPQFDIVNAYGPYNAYFPDPPRNLASTEHGTLRDFVWAPTVMSRRSLEGYRDSAITFVTNQDNLRLSREISSNSSHRTIALPHPTNPEVPGCTVADLPPDLRSLLQSTRKIVVAPARHSTPSHTDRGKGSSHLYEVIRRAAVEDLPVTFVLVEWGDSAQAVRSGLADLESAGFVRWTPLLSRPLLGQLISNSDGVLDQFVIPAYGAIGLDALRFGKTLLTRSDADLDREFFGSAAPVLNVENADSAMGGLKALLAMSDSRGSRKDVVDWFETHASWRVSLRQRLVGYQWIIDSRRRVQT